MATQKEDQKLVFKINYRLMQVKSIAECLEHSAILSTFIKLPFVFKTFVLSIFEWPLKTGFTVFSYSSVLITGYGSKDRCLLETVLWTTLNLYFDYLEVWK